MELKGKLARIAAERHGCKDEKILRLIETLATAEVHVEKTGFGKEPSPHFSMVGTMNGKPFRVILAGESIGEFV